MQQVRTHFSTAYELPLLTRAENYAQVSQFPPRVPASTPSPLNSENRHLGERLRSPETGLPASLALPPSPAVCRQGLVPCLSHISVHPGLAEPQLFLPMNTGGKGDAEVEAGEGRGVLAAWVREKVPSPAPTAEGHPSPPQACGRSAGPVHSATAAPRFPRQPLAS